MLIDMFKEVERIRDTGRMEFLLRHAGEQKEFLSFEHQNKLKDLNKHLAGLQRH
ncbi:MAG TPA: hypothetical protein PL110_19540 [Candidatus Eremiobacteraeota bacterium]|nr:MAG: hypothetical protein BWY64_02037 [bacterium ADurb.Bin363]HPZ10293.1 hypothetical protein [Candidatus Eremiobacteraeota bacterium]